LTSGIHIYFNLNLKYKYKLKPDFYNDGHFEFIYRLNLDLLLRLFMAYDIQKIFVVGVFLEGQ